MAVSTKCFVADSLQFSCTNAKIRLFFGRWGTHYQVKAFQGFFLKVLWSLKILTLKPFGKLWDNLYIHFLVIIILFRFTCGEGKLCQNVKKSAIALSKITW